jgi:hypothetical protein
MVPCRAASTSDPERSNYLLMMMPVGLRKSLSEKKSYDRRSGECANRSSAGRGIPSEMKSLSEKSDFEQREDNKRRKS